MADDLLEIADLFRAAASQLRRLSKERIETEHDRIIAIELYVFKNVSRTEPAFPPDRCREAANLLEELADKLDALIR